MENVIAARNIDDWKQAFEDLMVEIERLMSNRQETEYLQLIRKNQTEVDEDLSARLHEIFSNKALELNLKEWKERLDDPLWQKRLEIFLKQMEIEQLNCDSTVTSLAEPLQERLLAKRFLIGDEEFDTGAAFSVMIGNERRALRQTLFTLSNEFGHENEGMLRSLIHARNRVAREKGYENFYLYAFKLTGSDLMQYHREISSLIANIRHVLNNWVARVKEKFGWEDLYYYDLMYIAFNFFKVDESLFPAAKMEVALEDMFESIGLEPKELGIDVELKSIPYGGYCTAFSKDKIKLIVNKRDGFSAFLTGTHEAGHALYDHFSSDVYPELYRMKSVIGHEGMAELFQAVSVQKEFLKKNFEVGEDVCQQIQEMNNLFDVIIILYNYMLSLIEFRMYENPQQDFQALSNACYHEVFGLKGEGPHPGKETFFVSFPVYIQDYIFACGIRDMIHEHFGIRGMYGQTEIFEKVKEVYMNPSERYTWLEKVETLCDGKFSFEYLEKHLSKGSEKSIDICSTVKRG